MVIPAPDNPQTITEQEAPETDIALAFSLRCNQPRRDHGNDHGEPLELIQVVHDARGSSLSDEYCLMCWDNNRIAACLENKQPDEEAENCDKNAGKKSRPESRYLEARDKCRHQQHHQRINYQQEKPEAENGQRDGQQDDDRSDNRIG